MSKVRLYEIAKELGKESKEVVARAKELGIEVKSHASSVENEVAARITASFSQVAAPKKETNQKSDQPLAKEQQSASAAKEVTMTEKVMPKPAAPTQKSEVERKAAPAKPKSRNFKAEREAKAKEQAERRNKQRENRPQKQQNGEKRNREERNPRNNRNNQNRNDRGNRSEKRDNRDHRNQDNRCQEQNRSNIANQNRPQTNQGPRIDFKARAAALKAEQNAEYARGSEERFKQAQAAKAAQREQKKRKEPVEELFKAAAPIVEATKPAPQSQVAPEAVPTPAVDTRRKKQARPDKKRDDFDREEDGPRKQQKNRSSQNQVRNQKNSNWNHNKKNKKGKNNRNNTPTPKPVTERKFHELPKEFEYTEGMTVAEIAKRIKREPAEIVKKLFMMGVMATQNQSLDGDTIELLMVDYGIEAHAKVEVDNADIERFFVDEDYLDPDALVERPPVVTIMGHVDHGKTTLLDTLRNSRVATGEAGGITQHIGAYQIEENGKKITFLDTPGHAAFTSMRARGASVTDITILVVAADDGVMPQTIEAINHSKAANVPIIVAINKIDKPGANPERVIGELAEYGVMSTAWGGDSEFVEISAKFNQNIDELLETVLLVAEIQELKADPKVRAIGTVIEARLDKGKGAVATLLVQQGTLNVQDPIVVGNTFGRVRAMTNDRGRRVKVAGPSTPVSITGLNETPMAGDHFAVYEDEKAARAAGEERAKRALMKQRQATHRVSLENLFDTLKAGEVKSVNVIIKADVQGSAEALTASLQKIEVEVVLVHISFFYIFDI